LGHSNIETTMGYLHLCQAPYKQAFSPLDTLFERCAQSATK
jgi:integrase/recombinase XerD